MRKYLVPSHYTEGSKYKRLYLVSQKSDLNQAPWKLPLKTLRHLQTLKNLDEKLKLGFYPRLILEYDKDDFKVLDEIAKDENKPSIIKVYEAFSQNLVIHSKKELEVSGKELDDYLELEDKSSIQPILDYLIDEVLEKRIINQKESLLNYAKTYKK